MAKKRRIQNRPYRKIPQWLSYFNPACQLCSACWDYWVVNQDGVDYYNYKLNENGKIVSYGSAPEDYETDVLHRKAMNFLDTTPTSTPFFLYLSTHAAHDSE